MIELSKADIETIAAERYRRTHVKRFVVAFMLWLAAGFISLLLLRPVTLAVQIVVIAAISGVWFYWFYRYLKVQDKTVKEFVSKCEADPELIYKEAAYKKDATDWL